LLLIDNCPASFGNQVGNGIPIQPFHGEGDDGELLLLQRYLMKLIDRPLGDVVQANCSVFCLDKIRQCNESTEYIRELLDAKVKNSWLADPPAR